MFNKQDDQTSIFVVPISDVRLQYVIIGNLYMISFYDAWSDRCSSLLISSAMKFFLNVLSIRPSITCVSWVDKSSLLNV